MSKITLSRKQQFRLLELILIWEGSVQRKKIAQTFGIALNHVTNVIREYEQLYPDNLKYDQRKRKYSLGDKFKPRYCKGTSQEYLCMLKGQINGMEDLTLSVDILEQCACVPEPEQNVNPNILRVLIAAMLSAEKIKVKYQSLKDEQASYRIITPQRLVSIEHRWHARSFDHDRKEYRDFVLHRIISTEPIPGRIEEVPPDNDWVNELTLDIIPNPDASDGQKTVIAKEYGMKYKNGEWEWKVSIKKCLVPYLARSLRLDESAGAVSRFPIVLKNKSEAASYFFKEC